MNKITFFKLIRFRKKLKYLLFSLSILLLFLISSCVKDGDFEFDKLAQNQFDPTLAAPFINSKLTLKDILKDTSGIIQVDIQTNALKLVYNSDNMVSVMAKDLFEIPDQSIQTDTSNLVLIPPTGDSNFYSITKPYSFQLPKPEQKLDSVFIKHATLKLSINTDINHKGRVKLTIPNMKFPNGQNFRVEIPIDYNGGTTPYVINIPPIDISGCKITFNNLPGHRNEVIFKYEHWLYKDLINPYNSSYFIQVNDVLENISYDKLVGYIGQYEFPMGDTTEISVFNTQLEGNFELDNIKIGGKIENSFGLPLELKVDKLQAQNGSVIRNINDFPSPNPIPINSPTPAQIGQTVTTTISPVVSTDLANAFNISPKKIIYKVTGKANPANDSSISNFIIDTSNFKVSFNIEVPLEGKVGGFVLQDTIGFDLATKIKEVDEVTFKIYTNNAFPLDAYVQVYFTDNLFHVIDSMITNNTSVIQSGNIDPVLHTVTSARATTTEVVISKERVRKIESLNTQKLIIKARLTSGSYSNNQIVKITNNDFIDVKLGMKAKVNIKP